MFKEKITPLMRPHQTEALKEEARAIEAMLNAPPHISSAIQNRGDIVRHFNTLTNDIENQTPKPYRDTEIDLARRREVELRETITQGMPTQKEMRRNPAGAVDKHLKWERENKQNILEWKNIRLRLHNGGHLNEIPEARDVANFEQYRPADASHELNMHNMQISGKDYYLPPTGSGPVAVMSDEQADVLKQVNPELFSKMAMLSNDQRAEILNMVNHYISLPEEVPINPDPIQTEGIQGLNSIGPKVKKKRGAKAGLKDSEISEAEKERRKKASIRLTQMHQEKRLAKGG